MTQMYFYITFYFAIETVRYHYPFIFNSGTCTPACVLVRRSRF